MSLEAKIEALTAAVAQLTGVIQNIEKNGGVGGTAAVQAPVPEMPAPVVQAAPAAAPAMPAPPSFAAPAPQPAAASAPAPTSTVPFSDGQGLLQYVMGVYKELGAQKGAGIQTILTGLGYQNINDVKPEHYADLYSRVEQLKAS